jgi:hypothetical protein
VWAAGVPQSVFLALNAVADETDVTNLRLDIEQGLQSADHFFAFCRAHALEPSLASAVSACAFLEERYGRRLAWVHLPEDAEPTLLQTIRSLMLARGHIVKEV